jgi:signal transduction histidine kinase
MEKRNLEPGLLAVFRVFTGLRLAFAVILALTRLATPERDLRIMDLLEPAVLMAILSIPALRSRHEHILLPVALTVAGLGPLLAQAETLSDNRVLKLPIESMLALQTWGSMIVLLLPLIICAWQYRVRQVLTFSVGVTLINLALISLTVNGRVFKDPLVMGSIVFRLITFIVVGWLVVRLMSDQREQRRALNEANRKLTHHAATLEQLATTRERNRLARELHDTLAHTLSAVAVQLEAVDALWSTKPDDAHLRLRKTIETTRSGLTETRRALQDLRASPLEDLGLALAIRDLAETTASRGGLKLDIHIADRLPTLPSSIEQAAYRIAQEALANVINHANAHHVTVQLTSFNSHLVLVVSDDGTGFDPAANNRARRFGIQGMRERAEMIGGSLEVESQPDQGTLVMFSVGIGS